MIELTWKREEDRQLITHISSHLVTIAQSKDALGSKYILCSNRDLLALGPYGMSYSKGESDVPSLIKDDEVLSNQTSISPSLGLQPILAKKIILHDCR